MLQGAAWSLTHTENGAAGPLRSWDIPRQPSCPANLRIIGSDGRRRTARDQDESGFQPCAGLDPNTADKSGANVRAG